MSQLKWGSPLMLNNCLKLVFYSKLFFSDYEKRKRIPKFLEGVGIFRNKAVLFTSDNEKKSHFQPCTADTAGRNCAYTCTYVYRILGGNNHVNSKILMNLRFSRYLPGTFIFYQMHEKQQNILNLLCRCITEQCLV